MNAHRQRNLTLIVFVVVIVGLALGLLIPASGALDTATSLISRWFFAVFCTLYAFAQARVYMIRRRRQARLAKEMPVFAFGFFTVVWFVLAAGGIAYGVVGGDGWKERAAWVTIVAVICIQLLVLGSLQRRSEPR